MLHLGRWQQAIDGCERARPAYEELGLPTEAADCNEARPHIESARKVFADAGADDAHRALARAREAFANMGADNRVAECDELRDRLN